MHPKSPYHEEATMRRVRPYVTFLPETGQY